MSENNKKSSLKTLKRYTVSKCVLSGDKVEFYDYSVPIRCEFSRQHAIIKSAFSDMPKRDDNLSRSRQNVRRIIWANLSKYTKFLTLTCSEPCLEKKDFNRHIQTFLQSMKRQGYELRYLMVYERQLKRGEKEGNKGSLHAHLVVFNEEKIPLKVIKKAWSYGRTELKILNSLRYDKTENGYVKGEKVRDIGAYVCKYITKEAALEFGSWTYRCSRGLNNYVQRPFEFNVVADGDFSIGVSPLIRDDDAAYLTYRHFRDSAKVDYMNSKIVQMRYSDFESYQIIDYCQATLNILKER